MHIEMNRLKRNVCYIPSSFCTRTLNRTVERIDWIYCCAICVVVSQNDEFGFVREIVGGQGKYGGCSLEERDEKS